MGTAGLSMRAGIEWIFRVGDTSCGWQVKSGMKPKRWQRLSGAGVAASLLPHCCLFVREATNGWDLETGRYVRVRL